MARGVTQLRVGAKTDVGRKRDHNEDDLALYEQYKDRDTWQTAETKGSLFLVADGMGGQNAGEVASKMVADLVPEYYYRELSPSVKSALCQAIEAVNSQIFERAQQSLGESGMGSTIVTAVIRGDELHIAHVGDSRIYLVRGKQIRQLTHDHSWVAEQVAAGLIGEAEARTHPYRNYVTRSLGPKDEVEIDYDMLTIQEGDVVLLCSDGLSGPLDDATLLRILGRGGEPLDACEELIRQANDLGGPDNITAIVVSVDRVVPVRGEEPVRAVGAEEAATLGRPIKPTTHKLHGRGTDKKLLPILLAMLGVVACAALLAFALPMVGSYLQRPKATTTSSPTTRPSATPVLIIPTPTQGIIEASPTNLPPPQPAVVPTKPSADTPTSAPTATFMPTNSPPPTATPSLTPLVIPSATFLPVSETTAVPTGSALPKLRVVATWGVNVRSSPDKANDSNVIDTVPEGTELGIVGCYRRQVLGSFYEEWFRVWCVGSLEQEGWVFYDPLIVASEKECGEVPELPYP